LFCLHFEIYSIETHMGKSSPKTDYQKKEKKKEEKKKKEEEAYPVI